MTKRNYITVCNEYTVTEHSLSRIMTRCGWLHNTYCTYCHSIRTCDIVQEDVSSRTGIRIDASERYGGFNIIAGDNFSLCYF